MKIFVLFFSSSFCGLSQQSTARQIFITVPTGNVDNRSAQTVLVVSPSAQIPPRKDCYLVSGPRPWSGRPAPWRVERTVERGSSVPLSCKAGQRTNQVVNPCFRLISFFFFSFLLYFRSGPPPCKNSEVGLGLGLGLDGGFTAFREGKKLSPVLH